MDQVLYEATFKFNFVYILPLIIFLISVVMRITCRKFFSTINTSMPKLYLAFKWVYIVLIVFSIVVQCRMVSFVVDMHNRTIGAYESGEYKVVEGWVSAFHSEENDKEREFFQINRISFSYSPDELYQGYHTVQSDGGVIEGDGQYLRIGYVSEYNKNIILYIEEIEPVIERVPCNKEDLDSLFSVIGYDIELGGLNYGMALDLEHCYNVTPKEVAEQTDYKIFKFSDSCISVLLLDGEAYEFCSSFGGYGFLNAVPCDFDEDGNLDLLVSSSWGSGVHRSEISVFNTKLKTVETVYSTLDDGIPTDLYVKILPAADGSGRKEYVVYEVNIDIDNANFAELSFVTIGQLGTIDVNEEGQLCFLRKSSHGL